MARIFIGVGSNRQREKYLRAGMRELRAVFCNVRASTVYENRAVGFDGADFYNLVVDCETDLEVDEVVNRLHRIENDYGRDRQRRASSITLDLDLLLYDRLVTRRAAFHLPRVDVDRYAFVLRPLAELVPDLRHPVSGKTYATLWSEFDHTEQALRPVEFELQAE